MIASVRASLSQLRTFPASSASETISSGSSQFLAWRSLPVRMKPKTARRCEMRAGAVGFRSRMQMAMQLGIGLAFITNAVAIVLALAPLQAKGEEVLSPAAQRGLIIVRTN